MTTTDVEFGWFNQLCRALGLFDGARPESPERVMWREVLPMLEALKEDRPAAAIMIQELQRTRDLWVDALTKFSEANRQLLVLQGENARLRRQIQQLGQASE